MAVSFDTNAVEVGLQAAQTKHLGDDPTDGTLSAFSRMLFEAGPFVVAEIRSSVAGDDDGSRKLTRQERSSRMAAMRAKLGAWPIAGSFGPSNSLIGQAFGVITDSAVRYIPPSRCSSREQEVVAEKTRRRPLSPGGLCSEGGSETVPVESGVSNELRLYQAFSRRGRRAEPCKP